MSLPKSLAAALGRGVQELRLTFCQSSPASAGLREFVGKNYAQLKAANPRLPILVRESSGAPARVTARFPLGVENKADVSGLSEQQVAQKLEELLKTGDTLPRPQGPVVQ